MKTRLAIFLMGFLMVSPLMALEAPKKPVAVIAESDKTVAASPTPAPIVAEDIAPASEETKVLVPESAAPPEWLSGAIDKASSVPVIGPYVITIAKYLGVLASIVTLLVTFLIGAIKVLMPVLNLVNLERAAAFLFRFQTSKIMYYLKFFSMYNAKKKENGTDIKVP